MSEWKVSSLKEFIKVSSGEGLPDSKMNPGQHPVYGGNGIMGFHNEFLFKEPRLIIGRVGALCGNVHITQNNSWITDNALIVSFLNSNEDVIFWYYILSNINLREYAFQSAQPVITGGIVEKIKINIPVSTSERGYIAHILITCDTVIKQTQSAIAKYKAIKQGLLHDLFTRGLDANGHLRPSYQEAPELYKESELGMIPKEWEVKRLDEFKIDILDGDRGVNYPKSTDFFPDEFCLFLSATNVTKNGFVFQNMQFITKEKDLILGTGKLQRNDIVLTTRGTVGNMAFYSADIEYENLRINSGMLILRNNQNDINSTFLYLSIKEYIFGIEYGRVISGSAQPQLPIKDFRKFNLLRPEIEEQNEITKRITSIDNIIQFEETLLQKYQSIKRGLMGDLLGGRKTVGERGDAVT